MFLTIFALFVFFNWLFLGLQALIFYLVSVKIEKPYFLVFNRVFFQEFLGIFSFFHSSARISKLSVSRYELTISRVTASAMQILWIRLTRL